MVLCAWSLYYCFFYLTFLFLNFKLKNWACVCLCPSSRPDTSLLWFLTPFKAIKHLVCNQYKWLAIKIVTALVLLAMLALFLYSMPGYMVKKMLGAWDVAQTRLQKVPAVSLTRCLFDFLSSLLALYLQPSFNSSRLQIIVWVLSI